VRLRRDLAQSFFPEERHVDVARQRHQSLVRADVRRRFLTADVLLARRKSQTERAAPLGVPRLPHEPPGDLALMRRPAGQKPEKRAAVVHRDAERLGFAACDVRAGVSGGSEQRQ